MKKPWLALLLLVSLLVPSPTRAQGARPTLLPLVQTVATQLDLAVQQATFGAFSVTLAETQRNAQQVLNILVGQEDPSFDHHLPTLGDAVGLLDHIGRLVRVLNQLEAAKDYRPAADNVRFFAQASLELLKSALGSDSAERARWQVRMAQGLLLAARGAPDDLPSEGGVRTLLAFLRSL